MVETTKHKKKYLSALDVNVLFFEKFKRQKQNVCNIDANAKMPIPGFSNGRNQATCLFLP